MDDRCRTGHYRVNLSTGKREFVSVRSRDSGACPENRFETEAATCMVMTLMVFAPMLALLLGQLVLMSTEGLERLIAGMFG